MIPGISDEAEAVIIFKYWWFYIVLGKSFVDSDVRAQANCFELARDAFLEDFCFGFNGEVINFVPPGDEICRPLVAKLFANFFVSA